MLEIRLLGGINVSFYSQFSELPILQCPHVIAPLRTPTDALCHSAGRTTAPTSRAETISWFSTGLPHPPPAHCQTPWKLLETSSTFARSRHVHQSVLVKKGGKGKFSLPKLQYGQIISGEPGVHVSHNSSGATSQAGQVRYRPTLTIPSYSL